jgi:hypothetical protein
VPHNDFIVSYEPDTTHHHELPDTIDTTCAGRADIYASLVRPVPHVQHAAAAS